VRSSITKGGKMYYSAISVTTRPGMRFQGIEHLKKLAGWLESKYEVRTQVLGSLSGKIYRNSVVSRYDSLDHMEKTYEKVLADPEYLDWFKEGQDLLFWDDASQDIFQVF
jgi:hypothetical protein